MRADPRHRLGGRMRDPVWEDVTLFEEDKAVVCRKCEQIIHELGFSHVDRVRQHMTKNCSKRPKTALLTSMFPPALSTLPDFHEAVANCIYEAGLSFNCLQHPSFLRAIKTLHPDATVPADKALRTTLFDKAYDSSIQRKEDTIRAFRKQLPRDVDL